MRGNDNVTTGSDGLVAIDKKGNQVLFLDPESYAVVSALTGFAPRVHELAISPDHRTAFVPIYGDGHHGNNPAPGHLIEVIDLPTRRHVGQFDIAPYLAPHGMRWGADDQLYCTCEASGVVLEIDPASGTIRHAMDVGSCNAHRIEVLLDGSKLYTENEEDGSATILDLKSRTVRDTVKTGCGLAGIALSPDGGRVVLVDAASPRLLVIDTTTDRIVQAVALGAEEKPGQIARFSPDGRHLVVTSLEGGSATILTGKLRAPRRVSLGQQPMDMAFHADGRTVLIGNQGDGTISVVDLESAAVVRTVGAGVGVETLSFF